MKNRIVGLSEEQVKLSREKYGANVFEKVKKKGFFGKFIENLSDPIIKILLIALVVQVVFTLGRVNYFEVGGILAAILIAATVSTLSELGSEAAFSRMEAENTDVKIKVLRDGEIKLLLLSQIVVGDVVYIASGDKIPADGIMIDGAVSVNQMALNGEGKEVKKSATTNRTLGNLLDNYSVYCGCEITDGIGIMKVLSVGESTFYGQVAKDVQDETRESPLKLRLGKLAAQISKLGYFMAVLVALTFLFNTIVVDNAFIGKKILEDLTNGKFLFDTFIHALTLMITVIVVSTPEGLPMMITVVLSANMKKLLRDKILVKKLVGIETAGSMNLLFTDKTGTVTEGKLSVDAIITNKEVVRTQKAIARYKKVSSLLKLTAKYNTDSLIENEKIVGGNSTDRAFLNFFDKSECEAKTVVFKQPFKSENKYSCVRFSDGLELYKGAPEIILDKCNYELNEDGEVIASSLSYAKNEYNKRIARGERLIVVAFTKKEYNGGFVFVSLVSLKDKIRSDAKQAIKSLIRSGVQIVMLTGDGKETALSIAEESGIVTSRDRCIAITSSELSAMSDEEVIAILPELRVVARALPRDKRRLVELAQGVNLVVGMTGDGINDAPSLKLADVGFSMGSGADIAKDASDVVILDDSISAIGKAVLYGRTIFKSIRKFITFQLIMNIAACGVSFVGQLIGIDNPITIVQMLWVNIIMDTLGGLAFAGEAPLPYYMKEKPKTRSEALLSREMLSHVCITGAYTLLLCVLFLCCGFFKEFYLYAISPDKFFTAFYALFIFAGIFNCLAARCERLWILSNISKNKAFILIMILITAIQIAMIYCGGSIFRCTPLSFKELSVVIALAFTVIPFEMMRRIFYKLK